MYNLNFLKANIVERVFQVILSGYVLLFAGTTSPNQLEQFTLELVPGKNYESSTRWFVFKMPIYPQLAVWIESEEGRYLRTLFVTKKGGKKKWISAPKEGRPEALPVWNHLWQGEIDGITAATSKAETFRTSKFTDTLLPGNYVIKLETNISYDYNSNYTKENSGVNGQPSLVYQALLTTNKDSCCAVFLPVGTGSKDGSDGKIYNLDGIDSAFELFSKMMITYRKQ